MVAPPLSFETLSMLVPLALSRNSLDLVFISLCHARLVWVFFKFFYILEHELYKIFRDDGHPK